MNSFFGLFTSILQFLKKKSEVSEKCLKRLLELERQARSLAKQRSITHRHSEIDRYALENIRKVIEDLIIDTKHLFINSPALQEKLSRSLKILRQLDCNEGATDTPSFIAIDLLLLWGFTDEKPITFQTIDEAKQFLNSSMLRRAWMRVTRQA